MNTTYDDSNEVCMDTENKTDAEAEAGLTTTELKDKLRERFGLYIPATSDESSEGDELEHSPVPQTAISKNREPVDSPKKTDKEGIYISAKQDISWVPHGVTSLKNIQFQGFVESEEWDMTKGYYVDPDFDHPETNSELFTDSDEKGKVVYSEKRWGDFYTISHGDTTHVVQADLVDGLAEIVDVPPTWLLDTAQLRADKETYPVMFDEHIPGGRMIVFPIKNLETGGSPLNDLA